MNKEDYSGPLSYDYNHKPTAEEIIEAKREIKKRKRQLES